jgi:hypothetical protein
MKLMGQSTVTVPEQDLHSSPETAERVFESLQKLNRKDSEAKNRLILPSVTETDSKMVI